MTNKGIEDLRHEIQAKTTQLQSVQRNYEGISKYMHLKQKENADVTVDVFSLQNQLLQDSWMHVYQHRNNGKRSTALHLE